ncbi:MAG: Nitrate/nitrite transporter NarK [Chloroflexi bacterium OLB14]|nr:MAG: Nitrate/nitrite transporter NarK [Chloroflexi bacterium OLB14]
MNNTWLSQWDPENQNFWKETGSKIAWRTLIITTIGLTFSFATWFMMSAIVVRIPQIGFKFNTMQLFWLAAMPGLAGGTLRIINMFLIPIYGTRHVITYTTILKLIPCIGIGLAVMNQNTPFWVFMVLAFTAGFGGGDFSSYMPSTRFFFPKNMQGTALGVQAGIGNFGVSLVQFITPWIIGISAFGASQTLTIGDTTKTVWLQNAAFWYAPFLVIGGMIAWNFLRSVPIKASFKEQLDIFKIKHTWFCTITYLMTFGTFSGLSAAFPLLIKNLYGSFDGAPDPLAYAFLGPLVGSLARIMFGPVADKYGGAILTHITGIVLIISTLAMAFLGLFTPTSLDQFNLFVIFMLILFFFTGIGNAATFRQYPIIFADSPRQSAGVIGWTAAIAAYGPFIFSTLIGESITHSGSPLPFFYGTVVFFVIATAINWWYYTRKGCEKPS